MILRPGECLLRILHKAKHHCLCTYMVFILIWNDCSKIIVLHLISLMHLFKWLPFKETLFKWLPVRWTLFKQLAVKWTLFKPLPVYDDWKLSLGECLKTLFKELPVGNIVKTHPISLKSRGEMNISLTFTWTLFKEGAIWWWFPWKYIWREGCLFQNWLLLLHVFGNFLNFFFFHWTWLSNNFNFIFLDQF